MTRASAWNTVNSRKRTNRASAGNNNFLNGHKNTSLATVMPLRKANFSIQGIEFYSKTSLSSMWDVTFQSSLSKPKRIIFLD